MFWTSLVAQMIKNLPAMQETWVQSLGWEDPLEKGMVTHSSIFAWKIPWTEESGQLQSTGSQRVGHNWVTNTQTPEPYMFRCYGLSQYIEQSRRWVWLMILVNVNWKSLLPLRIVVKIKLNNSLRHVLWSSAHYNPSVYISYHYCCYFIYMDNIICLKNKTQTCWLTWAFISWSLS